MFTSLGRWFQRQCRRGRLVAAARRPRTRLRVEWLEDRVVPATFDVTNTADVLNQAGTLRNAIQQANVSTDASNIIYILTPGTYAVTLTGTPNESDNAAGEFAINLQSGGSLTINNNSGGAVIIDARGACRVFDINPGSASLAAVAQVVFNGNNGGLTITNGKAATTNDAAGSGGDIRDQGPVGLTLNNVTVSNGSAGGDGGGIAMENLVSTPWSLTLDHSTVVNNHAQDAGGGIDVDGIGAVTITNSLVTSNSAVNQGGGIWLDAIGVGTANLNVTQSVISNNFAGMLGAGFGNAGDGAVTVANSVVSGNVTQGFGGGFADQNNVGTLTILDSLFQNNKATGSGGGVFAGGPATTINNSEFQGNLSSADGGGAFLGPNGSVNPAAATSAFHIVGTTFANNTANVNGGGIELQTTTGSTSTANITNSTITGNSALTGTGGGIDVATGFTGTVTLTDDTVTNNFAATTGGVAFAGTAGGTVKVQNTIIALNNGANPDVSSGTGTFTDLGNNILGFLPTPNTTGFTAATDQTGPFTALVSGLRDNGGAVAGVTQFYGAGLVGNDPAAAHLTVQTEALVPTSAARGKGAVVTGITTDERGFPRTGTVTDVGAFAFQNATLTLNVTATNTNGTTTVTVTVTNNSGNNLPADNSILLVTLPAGLTANGATSFTLPALAAGQTSAPFTVTATGTPTGSNVVTATVNSPDANPNAVTATVGVSPPAPPPTPTPVGQLMVFAIGFVNGQLVIFFVDQKGQIFDESFNFTNFFNPNPANASFFNSGLELRNMAPTNVFGSPGILGSILDENGNASLATTVPLNFITAAALNDIIHALQQPGA